jgi:hypothetical protein
VGLSKIIKSFADYLRSTLFLRERAQNALQPEHAAASIPTIFYVGVAVLSIFLYAFVNLENEFCTSRSKHPCENQREILYTYVEPMFKKVHSSVYSARPVEWGKKLC